MNENDNKKNGFNNDGNQIGEQQNLAEECTEEYVPKISKRELYELPAKDIDSSIMKPQMVCLFVRSQWQVGI